MVSCQCQGLHFVEKHSNYVNLIVMSIESAPIAKKVLKPPLYFKDVVRMPANIFRYGWRDAIGVARIQSAARAEMGKPRVITLTRAMAVLALAAVAADASYIALTKGDVAAQAQRKVERSITDELGLAAAAIIAQYEERPNAFRVVRGTGQDTEYEAITTPNRRNAIIVPVSDGNSPQAGDVVYATWQAQRGYSAADASTYMYVTAGADATAAAASLVSVPADFRRQGLTGPQIELVNYQAHEIVGSPISTAGVGALSLAEVAGAVTYLATQNNEPFNSVVGNADQIGRLRG